MNWKKIAMPVLAIVLLAGGWRGYGWGGVALAGGAVLMYLLLHFNRMMHVLKRAAERPKGYVGSAVMLNAKLRPGVNLLHVMALTQSIGEQLSPADEQPEIFRWTDATQSSVTCEFHGGKLAKWALARPQSGDDDAAAAPAP